MQKNGILEAHILHWDLKMQQNGILEAHILQFFPGEYAPRTP